MPYGDLPDSEREYGVTSVVETLKVIHTLGYRIVPNDAGARP